MDETIKEFDHSKYSGQVHVWKYQAGTINGEPSLKIWICRRYTGPDDTDWGCWIQVDGDDKDEVAIKLLHFCSYLNYEVVAPDYVEERGSLDLWKKYQEEAEHADKIVSDIDGEINKELSSLFASFAEAKKLSPALE